MEWFGCTALHHPPGEKAEQQLDLVHLGGMQGREVVMELSAVACIEILPHPGAARVEVVPDDVDWLFGLSRRDLLHESQQIRLGAGIPVGGEGSAGLGEVFGSAPDNYDR